MRWLSVIGAAGLLATPLSAQLPAPTAFPVPLAKGTETRPVQLSKIVLKLERGDPYGHVKLGLLCIGSSRLMWRNGRQSLALDDFDDVFGKILGDAGFDVVKGTADLFEADATQKAEFLIGGTITSIMVDACLPNSGLGDTRSAKGKASVTVEWQVYNRLTRQVVARVPTTGRFSRSKTDMDGVSGLIAGAFGDGLRTLLGTGTLHKLLIGTPQDMTVARTAKSAQTPLLLSFAPRSAGSLPQVVGSTVLVQSGDGHGSGFLISPDGYFLTNRHVVGGAKYVKLRWSDGLEAVGEVVRRDGGRDVALIKADARSRVALHVRKGGVPVGTEVFAVGAPLDRELQNSVTRGIVSANRVLDGYSFLQSDVSVQPGNSGGPLVDARGDVVGLTVSGIRINDAATGLNFFVPIEEALAFLAVGERH